MAQLSDDCFAFGGPLMTVAEAGALMARRLTPVTEPERVGLMQASGRILAEDVVAGADVPPHDNSAVDGYAVHFDDLRPDGETRLPVLPVRVAAGHPVAGGVPRGRALRIFTGAVMPPGPDTVMMQEDCAVEHGPNGANGADETVVIRPGIARGANRRRAGEDVRAGSVVLKRGTRLRPQDIGMAASVGRVDLAVYRPLRVALFSTGDELREPGTALTPGTIYDSNRYTLAALLSGLGCAVSDLGILADRAEAVREALARAAGAHDLIVTSGGVSVGDEDHVKTAVEALGSLHVWRLAIKPGRPAALGQVGRTPFLGLPGNPVAVMVTFYGLARALVLTLAGAVADDPHRFRVRAGFAHKKKAERREFLRARLERDGDGALVARRFPRDGAGILSSMVESDGLVELPEDLTRLEAGTMVDFLPFSEVQR
ncbi:MAG: molybdopterin molybdotransferase MoeA [Alphaproteobacteria bacterium]|nr:molybdopterin molybdotransferase MoeA [Alphaproteobacteria bacterium]